jgi:hypothetical protein
MRLSENEIDGNRMQVSGNASAASLSFSVEARGSEEKKTLQLEKRLYPSSALAFLPLQEMRIGKSARYAVFHGETQAIAEAEQEVLAYETSPLFEGPAFKVATRLLGLETTTWIAADGRPLFELGMGGVLISALEDESRARRYLVEASLNKRDALVEFSLLRAGPIEQPRGFAMASSPPAFPILSTCGSGPSRSDWLECRIDRSRRQGDTAAICVAPRRACWRRSPRSPAASRATRRATTSASRA